MSVCINCGKHANIQAWSRHKKGSSGHGGAWNLRAQISSRTQKPNIHSFKGKPYCTKCLRIVKAEFNRAMSKPAQSPAQV